MNTRLLAAIALLTASFGLRAAAPEPFVVHEWGTFTSVQGGSGGQIRWAPLNTTDLPPFVYNRANGSSGFRNVTLLARGDKGTLSAYLRMETPVIYFYSDAERDVNVRVRFPTGLVTEWYPRASRVGPSEPRVNTSLKDAAESVIEWHGVKVLPRDTAEISASELIRTGSDARADHYYAARNTDANFLRVSSAPPGKGFEHEKDLFYRGLGFNAAPLSVALDAGEKMLTLSSASAEPLTDVFVLTIRRGQMRYQKVARVTASEDMTLQFDAEPFGALDDTRKRLEGEVVSALEHQGLYTKEARAMVATWRDQWFAEEGTRALYLLPRAWTDTTLPLDISPRPNRVVRVMVGRAELIAPSTERALRAQIVAFTGAEAKAKRQAVLAARELNLGRFLAPAMQITLGKHSDAGTSQNAWQLVTEMTAEPVATPHVAQTGLKH